MKINSLISKFTASIEKAIEKQSIKASKLDDRINKLVAENSSIKVDIIKGKTFVENFNKLCE